jgi:hypothetical protein
MTRKIRWRRIICPVCGHRITNNALGRDAHIRHCTKEKAAAKDAKAEADRRARNPLAYRKPSSS